MIRQCGRAKPVFFETHANRVRLTTADAITFRDAPLSQIRVQFVDVFHLRYRCGPVTRRVFTRFSTTGFSLPLLGMQYNGSNAK